MVSWVLPEMKQNNSYNILSTSEIAQKLLYNFYCFLLYNGNYCYIWLYTTFKDLILTQKHVRYIYKYKHFTRIILETLLFSELVMTKWIRLQKSDSREPYLQFDTSVQYQ